MIFHAYNLLPYYKVIRYHVIIFVLSFCQANSLFHFFSREMFSPKIYENHNH